MKSQARIGLIRTPISTSLGAPSGASPMVEVDPLAQLVQPFCEQPRGAAQLQAAQRLGVFVNRHACARIPPQVLSLDVVAPDHDVETAVGPFEPDR